MSTERLKDIKARLEVHYNFPPMPRSDVRDLVADLEEEREALWQIIDEAHSSERNSVDSLIEIIDIAGKALAATEETSG